MLPLVIIAAATAAAQYYQSQKAAKASASELKKIEDEFKKLVPPKYNLSVMDPPAYIKQAIPEPTMDMSSITPEQFKLVGKYKPDVAPLIQEQRPDLVTETADSKEGRQAQLDALRKLKSIGTSSGQDPELAQAMDNANKQSQIQAQSRQQSILQDMARRGQLGSGATLAAQMQGGSDAMQQAAQSSRDASVAAYKNKLQALRDSASLGGDIHNQDISLQGKNADIINSFNQRTSKNRQDWENQRTGLLNNAQQYNLGAEQDIANANVNQNNKYAVSERDRQDSLQQYLYKIRNSELSRQNDIIEQQAKWKQGERDNQNKLLGGQFSAANDIYSNASGLGKMKIGQLDENAKQNNQTLQGIGNTAASGYSSYLDNSQKQDQTNALKDQTNAYRDRTNAMSPQPTYNYGNGYNYPKRPDDEYE